MAKVFYPRDCIMVPATCSPIPNGHPPNTEYKVAYGDEDWNGIFIKVYKVQMVYDGKISGRRSPSFPVGTEDCILVNEAMLVLYKKYNKI
ncbi:hypothetical protein [Clostridium sp. CF012]|uniref:hypothetical protein n=1 Tax=Clostridium sp. CF012 TaxID=2843319 RepID=UPI001C0B6087|nr:hypothetical protein [Clostridium sp. CF012]MBU3145606.1 hypothetical protein [Clostridium sp. CF012]